MKEHQEYPKWLPIGDGIIVWTKEEEEAAQIPDEEVTEQPKKHGRPRKGQ